MHLFCAVLLIRFRVFFTCARCACCVSLYRRSTILPDFVGDKFEVLSRRFASHAVASIRPPFLSSSFALHLTIAFYVSDTQRHEIPSNHDHGAHGMTCGTVAVLCLLGSDISDVIHRTVTVTCFISAPSLSLSRASFLHCHCHCHCHVLHLCTVTVTCFISALSLSLSRASSLHCHCHCHVLHLCTVTVTVTCFRWVTSSESSLLRVRSPSSPS